MVIGRDGKQVLMKHDGTYLRVSTCRLTRVPENEVESEREENNVIEDEVPELHLNSSSHVCEDKTDIVENTAVTGILLDQNQYLSSLQPLKVSTARAANKSSNLSKNEKTEYIAN